ncbi:NAD(P)/FAD-dependent oxidoreductase [Methylocystis bryophila]|uniref:NAD(P)/FAD-dependent oxidoreductase n=1 Tax=Methylocystis bryophila TaxID=655015 RepID=UPI001319CA35|nr:NAD(P)/FAD-dependent oxidoreductase [Methylocystis bryophila]
MTKTDVIVVGGGPAGLAAALAVRSAGLEVCVVDLGAPPIEKACGEGLMPDGVAALRALGVPLDGKGSPFRGIRFIDRHHVAEASFPGQAGVGLRRSQLHQILIAHAEAAGVEMLWRTRATAIESGGLRLEERFLPCRWIIGADGVNSQVRRWTGLEPSKQSRRRLGLRRHFRAEPWTDFVEVHWAKGEQAYVTPVGREEICIALLGRTEEAGFENLERRFPRLWERLRDAEPVTALRGAPTGTMRLRRVTRANVALIGDASAAIDAISGDGLSLAFHQAVALGDALRQRKLALYEARHREICRAPFLIARLLLLMDRHEALRRVALQALASGPAIFNGLLATHVGSRHPAAASLDIAALGLRLLAQAAARVGSATP